MYKQSRIITRLQPHQEAALKRALVRNLILAHSTGSGKTLTSIAIADALGKPTTVFTPASLVENYKKELAKHKRGGPPVEVISLPTAVSQNYQVPIGNTLIIDEAHSLRNAGTARQAYIKDQLDNAGRVFALTGTPAYNNITDWAPLVNIVAKERVLPEKPGDFREKYIREQEIRPAWWQRARYGVKPGVLETLRNTADLKRRLQDYVDVFDADVEKPKRTDKVIHTWMTPEQLRMYRYLEKNLPPNLYAKLRYNLPPSKAEARQLNAFLSGVRQVSNTPEAFDTTSTTGEKIRVAVDNIKKAIRSKPGMRALVYSNFLDSGVKSYAKLLDKEGIPYGLYTGELRPSQKKAPVDAYNAGKLPVLLASGAGSEGLDLKGTRLIQLLEPHWNESRLDQVIGRGIRYKSHDELPPEERTVTVEHYISDVPPEKHLFYKKPVTSVDNYLTARAREKAELMDQVKALFVQDNN